MTLIVTENQPMYEPTYLIEGADIPEAACVPYRHNPSTPPYDPVRLHPKSKLVCQLEYQSRELSPSLHSLPPDPPRNSFAKEAPSIVRAWEALKCLRTFRVEDPAQAIVEANKKRLSEGSVTKNSKEWDILSEETRDLNHLLWKLCLDDAPWLHFRWRVMYAHDIKYSPNDRSSKCYQLYRPSLPNHGRLPPIFEAHAYLDIVFQSSSSKNEGKSIWELKEDERSCLLGGGEKRRSHYFW